MTYIVFFLWLYFTYLVDKLVRFSFTIVRPTTPSGPKLHSWLTFRRLKELKQEVIGDSDLSLHGLCTVTYSRVCLLLYPPQDIKS